MTDGHPFPLPRAWPAMLGAADMPIGCALTFSGQLFEIAAEAKMIMAGTSPAMDRHSKTKLR
jgi:hypothetical protein